LAAGSSRKNVIGKRSEINLLAYYKGKRRKQGQPPGACGI